MCMGCVTYMVGQLYEPRLGMFLLADRNPHHLSTDRDIKPGNILWQDGSIRLTDFGCVLITLY